MEDHDVRRALVATVAAAALAASVLLGAAPAYAGPGAIQCRGYAACEAQGKSAYGYPGASSVEYWRMVSGHNCTNYAAYRLISAGMSSVRPWDGNGNANAWGLSNADITDRTPTVGSIAWWDAGHDGAGSVGHVSVVERVVSPTRIVVSEDNYLGDFAYRIVDASAGTWPSGFVHLKDASVSASFPSWRARALGQTVWADATRAQPASGSFVKPGSTEWVTLTYLNTGDTAWSGLQLRVKGAASAVAGPGWLDGTTPAVQKQPSVITGGTATFSFSVQIPAGVPDGTQYSSVFTPVDASGAAIPGGDVQLQFTADSRDPFAVQPPLGIAGAPRQNSILTSTTGAWAPVQPVFSYQWTRDGSPIANATGPAYRLTGADVGRTVALTAVASAPGYLPVSQAATLPTTVRSISPNALARGVTMRGTELVSTNGQYRLVVTKTGKAAVLDRWSKRVAWTTARVKAVKVKLRSDGVLVAYDARNHAVWKTAGAKSGANRAVVTNTGKLVLYSATDRIKWNSAKHRS
ncbi:CHAP domain-containing protein [Galbitalea sp. SE-J8]|uniref:CHAP domain-containing protein n=1 Tax=Galbitalea sp. SE-J8 TaxID=3054952 RepID=UPI00259CCF8C|nr:CHAP domain-containing protein [Galbitalea sp. SE-J8]MDM4761453.1 CHAP domain-containing protein [Galbitalea sp. SE-J8]